MRCFFIYLTLFLQLILKTSVFSITQLTHKTITNMKTLITALCLMLSFGYAYTQVILYTPCETNIVPIAEDSSDVFTEKEGLWLNKTLNPLYEQQVLKGVFYKLLEVNRLTISMTLYRKELPYSMVLLAILRTKVFSLINAQKNLI